MALVFVAGTTLAGLLYAFTPSLSTIAISSGGSIVLNWALQKYVTSSIGNYYYVYQLLTDSTPDQIKEQVSPGLVGTTVNVGTSIVKTGANVTYYGSKALLATTGIAASATIAAGSLLLVTVTSTGKVMYTIASASSSTPQALYHYIKKQEPDASFEDFYNWETVEVNIPSNTNDKEMTEMLNGWQLIQREDELLESTLIDPLEINDEELFLEESILEDSISDNWVVVDDDYLFDDSNIDEFVSDYL